MNASTSKSNGETLAVKPVAPINLRERYGDKYRISYEESYYAQYGRRAKIDDPWLQIIVGRRGHIYPFGGNSLAASTNACGPVARRLAALPFCRTWQAGDDGVTVLFDVAYLGAVAKLLRIPKKRRLTAAQRRGLAEGAAYRFKKKPVVEGTSGDPELSATPDTTAAVDGQLHLELVCAVN